MKNSRAWKAFEYRVAELFGGIRNAFSGACPEITGSRADVRHQYLFIEAKYRQKHSVVSVWDETSMKAEVEHKIPVVVLAEKNRVGCWLLIYSGDLERLSKVGIIDDLPLFQQKDV